MLKPRRLLALALLVGCAFSQAVIAEVRDTTAETAVAGATLFLPLLITTRLPVAVATAMMAGTAAIIVDVGGVSSLSYEDQAGARSVRSAER